MLFIFMKVEMVRTTPTREGPFNLNAVRSRGACCGTAGNMANVVHSQAEDVTGDVPPML